MLLAIDVGNTNIVLGVFDGLELVKSWRLQTLRGRTADELGLLVHGLFAHDGLDRTRVRGVVISSVVPPLTGSTQDMVERYFGIKPLLVDPAARAIAGMQTDSQIAFEALDDDPLFAAYRNRVAEAIDALPEWSDRYLLSLRRGEVEATTALVAEFQARTALANAELEAAVADVDAAAAALIPDLLAGLEEARIKLG